MRAVVFLLVVGCSPDEDGSLFASTAEEDVAEVARISESIGLAPQTFDACDPQACGHCVHAEGTPVSGTFDVGIESLPCELTQGSVDRTITAASYTGTWTSSTSGVLVELSGVREVTLDRGAGRRAGSVQSSLDLHEATLDVDVDGVVTGFSFDAHYEGFSGGEWTLILTEEDGQLSGVASSASGTCTVGGTRSQPELSCGR